MKNLIFVMLFVPFFSFCQDFNDLEKVKMFVNFSIDQCKFITNEIEMCELNPNEKLLYLSYNEGKLMAFMQVERVIEIEINKTDTSINH